MMESLPRGPWAATILKRLMLLVGLALMGLALWTAWNPSQATGHERQTPPYDRREWLPQWQDFDGNCRSTREEVLLRDGANVVLSSDGCRVIAGRWVDPWTGAVVTDPALIDVDHVLPLRWSHEHGGSRWTEFKKRAFANDLSYRWHLVVTHRSVNRRKGALGPAKWQPPDPAIHCQWGQAVATIGVTWGLRFGPEDIEAIRKAVATC